MNLVADESVDGLVVTRLRYHGHTVLFIPEFDAGIGDTEVLSISRENDALLITADKDFGDLVFRQGVAHCGVLLIRFAGSDPEEKARLTYSANTTHRHAMNGAFSVLTRDSLRIRRFVI